MSRLRRCRPGRPLRVLPALLGVLLGLCLPGSRADGAAPRQEIVAVLKDSPPFSFQARDGSWMGLSVEMWSRVATALHLDARLEGMDRTELMSAVASGRARFGVGPLSITAARLEQVDFSVPIYTTGVAVAVSHARRRQAGVLLDAVLSPTFLRAFGGLLVVAVIVGGIFWIAERRANPAFSREKMRGWGAGIWLSVVTMTAVGYGDTVPRTLFGRVVATIWMFAGIVLISIFTGTVATLLTIEGLGPRIVSFEDLGHARVAAVTASAAAQMMQAEHLPALSFPDVDQALQALLDGRADALVYDRALLASTLVERPHLPVTILPGVARLEYYAFVLRPHEPLRRRINDVIAHTLDTAVWRQVQFTYLGVHGQRYWIGYKGRE